MPATITYFSVAPNTAIPVRVFVNRQKLLSSSAVAVNEKSIIKLSSINSIRLSNFDLTNLTLDIGPQVRELLLETPLAQLFPQRTVSRASTLATELSNTWKCRLVVSLGYLVDLRYKLSCLNRAADVRFLEDKKIDLDYTDSRSSVLLQRHLKFDFTKKEPVSDDESLSVEEKKTVSYTLQNQRLLNNKVVDPLDIYVLHRPRS
ncbi:hypothetical protein JCM33374_g1767 [Metschnikowia sp. JCM 33374]|nr:hypothetical protein JCM33374_g1767 [Metschnikowia sp. JCM 33374]